MEKAEPQDWIVNVYREALGVILDGPSALAIVSADWTESVAQAEDDGARRVEVPEVWETQGAPALNDDFVASLASLVRASAAPTVYLCLPPLSSRELPERLRSEMANVSLPSAAFIAAAEAREDIDRIAVLCSDAFLGRREVRARSERLADWRPTVVVSHEGLGSAAFAAHPMLRLTTVVFERTGAPLTDAVAGDVSPVRFIGLPDSEPKGGMSGVVADIRRLMNQPAGKRKHGFVSPVPYDPESELSERSYGHDAHARREELRAIAPTRPLDDLFDISIGRIHRAGDSDALIEADKPGGGPVVVSGFMLRDGAVNLDAARWRIREPREFALLQPGDLILPSMLGARHDRLRLGCSEVPPDAPPLVADHTTIVLRAKQGVEPDDVEVVKLLLASPYALDAAAGGLRGIRRWTVPELGALPVPILEGDLAEALRGLRDAREQLEEWGEEAAQSIGSLFTSASLSEGTARMLDTGRRLRERVRAARDISDPDHRARTLLPHPIAYRWREVQTGSADWAAYRAILTAAEVTVAYLATMGLAEARSAGHDLGSIGQVQSAFLQGHGLSFGLWWSIVDEVSAKSRPGRRGDSPSPFPELAELGEVDGEFREAVKRLRDRRNDEDHLRGVGAHELRQAIDDAAADLHLMMSELGFLADYPLRFIERTRVDTLTGQTHYEFRDLVGDHPLVPIKRTSASDAAIEAESLYFVGRDHFLYLARPFVYRLRCPHCGSWATFHPDRLDAETGNVVLKALEHQHTVVSHDATAALAQVGLLPSAGNGEESSAP